MNQIKKYISSIIIMLVLIILVACGNTGKKDSELQKVINSITYESILLDNVSENEIKTDLDLTTIIEGYRVSWTSNNVDIIANNGKVTRPSDEDKVVELTASITVEEETVIKTFVFKVIFKEVIKEAAFYDFSKLTKSTTYVKTETEFTVKDEISGQDSTFKRINANISETDNNLGVVLGVRQGNNWEDPYLTTDKIEGMTSIEITTFNWGSDQYYNKDYVVKVVIQTSVDGETWVDKKDIKEEIDTEKNGMSTFNLELDGTAVYVRLYIESAGEQPPFEPGRYSQYRLIVSSIKFFK